MNADAQAEAAGNSLGEIPHNEDAPAARAFVEGVTEEPPSPAGAPTHDPVTDDEASLASSSAEAGTVESSVTESRVSEASEAETNAAEADVGEPAIIESRPADMTTADGPVSDAEAREVSAGTRVIQSRNVESPRFRAPFNDLRGTVASPALPPEPSPELPTAPLGPPRSLPANAVNPNDMASGSTALGVLNNQAAAATAMPSTTAAFPAASPIAPARSAPAAGSVVSSADSSIATARGARGFESAGPIARGLPMGNLSLISRVSYESDRPSATADLLVRHALTPPEDLNWQMPGQAWPLYSVLERQGEPGAERSSRLAVIRAYWRLTTDVAAYNWAVEEGAFVAGLQALQPETETLALQAARSAAQARLQQARVAATGAQCELADIAGQSLREPLPLPSELPLVGPYQTRFETLFANRAPPAGIRRIATTIPLRAELLQTLAATVAADTDAIKELAVFHREGRVPLEPVLAAHDRLQRHRGEFLDAVRIYNDQIAEYALAIAGTSNNQTVVAMLVRNPTIVRAAQSPRVPGMSPTMPASGYSPAPAAGSSGFPNSNAGFPANAATNAPSVPSASSAPQGYAPQGYRPTTTPRTSSRGATWLSPAK